MWTIISRILNIVHRKENFRGADAFNGVTHQQWQIGDQNMEIMREDDLEINLILKQEMITMKIIAMRKKMSKDQVYPRESTKPEA